MVVVFGIFLCFLHHSGMKDVGRDRRECRVELAERSSAAGMSDLGNEQRCAEEAQNGALAECWIRYGSFWRDL